MELNMDTIISLIGTAAFGGVGWLWREVSGIKTEVAVMKAKLEAHEASVAKDVKEMSKKIDGMREALQRHMDDEKDAIKDALRAVLQEEKRHG